MHWNQSLKDRKKQEKRLQKIAKKMSPNGLALRFGFVRWLEAVDEQHRMSRAAKRMMNRHMSSSFNTWAAEILGQRGVGEQLRTAVKQGTAGEAVRNEVDLLLTAAGLEVAAKAINKGDDDGNSALHWASRKGFVAVVKLLLDRGGQPDFANSEGSSALHWAARKDQAAVVKLLLERGATRELKNHHGKTPLQYAKLLQMHAALALLETDDGARKAAAFAAQKSAADAKAKAEAERKRGEELKQRKAAAAKGKEGRQQPAGKGAPSPQKSGGKPAKPGAAEGGAGFSAETVARRQKAEAQLKAVMEPLDNWGELPDQAALEAALKACREAGVPPAVVSKAEAANEEARQKAAKDTESAATKIAAMRRGKAARKEAQERRLQKESGEPAPSHPAGPAAAPAAAPAPAAGQKPAAPKRPSAAPPSRPPARTAQGRGRGTATGSGRGAAAVAGRGRGKS